MGQGKQRTKAELIEAIGEEFRINQNRTQLFDDVAGEVLGLNPTDMRAMDIIQRLGRPTAGAVAAEAGLSSGGLTAVLDRLEGAGYIRRIRDGDDRRRVSVELTPEAERRVWRIWGPLKESWDRQAEGFSVAELRFLLGFLRSGNELLSGQVERIRAERR